MSDDQFNKPIKRPSTVTRPMRQFPMVGGPEEMDEEPGFDRPFELSAEEEEELKRARKEKLNPPITPQAKTRLEYLTDIGKMTKDVVIGGVSFTLRTLKSKEQRQVYLTLVDVNNKVDEAYNLKFHSLAHSLIKIDGQEIAYMVKINNFQDKLKILEDLEETVTDQLFAAYQELKLSSDKQFVIKDDKDLKEISSDLGKL